MSKKIIITESQARTLIEHAIEGMGGVPLLKKLSRKSIFGFGKFKGLSVQQVLNLRRLQYLRFIYYNINGVSFLDEILDEIGIYPEYRIQKPGTDPELGKELDQVKYGKMDIRWRSHMKKISGARALSNKVQAAKKDKVKFSKASMARRNQGHH